MMNKLRVAARNIAGLLSAVIGASPAAALAANTHWVESWEAAPGEPLPGQTPTPSFSNQTVRTKVHLSVGGSAVRIAVSNAFGTTPLVLGAAHVALATGPGAIDPSTDHALLFGGAGTITIAPGGEALSDPVAFSVEPLGDLSVSLFVPQGTGPATEHKPGLETTVIGAENKTSATTIPPTDTTTTRPFLTGVDVLVPDRTTTVVAIDDSITDGFHSTVDADLRWPDDLSRRLQHAYGDRAGVANAGIGGNRIGEAGTSPAAEARLAGTCSRERG